MTTTLDVHYKLTARQRYSIHVSEQTFYLLRAGGGATYGWDDDYHNDDDDDDYDIHNYRYNFCNSNLLTTNTEESAQLGCSDGTCS